MTRPTRRTGLVAAGLLAALALSLQAGAAQAGGSHGNGKNHPTPKTNLPTSTAGVSIEALLCVPELLANGTGAALTKSINGVENNGDGTYTIGFTYETNRPDGAYRLRDCAFRDTGGDEQYNALLDPVVGATAASVVSVSGGTGTGEITVLADEGDVVCDRVVLSGLGPPNFTHRSNFACIDLSEEEVPVGAIGGIGLMALSAGVFGVAYLTNKRRVRTVRASTDTH